MGTSKECIIITDIDPFDIHLGWKKKHYKKPSTLKKNVVNKPIAISFMIFEPYAGLRYLIDSRNIKSFLKDKFCSLFVGKNSLRNYVI